ncbi:MAG: FISUMP domain-containing protein [Patescibacteria group bacterium]|nr:prepilin-type N-terminal cleavage/methylation domain-containing protein [Patescibacteria group bacterium]
MLRNRKAFTLIELLVVIAIIGILATLAVVALQQARSRARDSKRVADVKQTQTALELFFNEQGRYPTVEEWNSGTLITSSGEMLMIDIPSAPYPADGVCDASQNDFYYQVSEDYSTYTLSFCLGNDISNLEEGLKCATPGGILNDDCSGSETGGSESTACYPNCQAGYICQSGSCIVDTFECGQAVTYNGHTYSTVGIGTQCWFKENLKTDKFSNNDPIPLVLGGSLPWRTLTDIAYTSYQDNSTYQSAYGNLYSYYAILDPRGICPPGWKVPTESDFLTLVNYISPRTPLSLTSCSMLDHPSNPSCSTNIHPYWSTNLSIQGDDHYGFSAVPGGRIWGGNNSLWNGFGTYSYFATQNLKYFRLYLGPSHSLSSANMNAGEYVRCVKE